MGIGACVSTPFNEVLLCSKLFRHAKGGGHTGDPAALVADVFLLGLILLACHQSKTSHRCGFVLLLKVFHGLWGDRLARLRGLVLISLVNERCETELSRFELGLPLIIGSEVVEIVLPRHFAFKSEVNGLYLAYAYFGRAATGTGMRSCAAGVQG